MSNSKIFGGKKEVRVAIVQTAPVYLDLEKSTDKACEKIIEAGKNGASLVAFSEAWLPGFPAWAESAASEIYEWAEVRIQLYDNALTIPSKETQQLCDAAAQANCNVVIGCQELDPRPQSHTLYNTLLFIDNHGKILGRHRKLTPTHMEKSIWGAGDGSDLRTYPTDIGRIGGLICGENVSSLFRARLISLGQEFHVMAYPAAASIEGPRMHEPDNVGNEFFGFPLARAHALEAGCFVLLACGYYTMEDFPEDFPLRDQIFLDDFRGGSCVFAPGGMQLTESTYGDTILYADCAADMIKINKAIIDTGGHYGRPDVVSLDWHAKPLLEHVEEEKIS